MSRLIQVIYWVSHYLFWFGCLLWFRLSRRGQEHIPREGPVVLAANHASFLDPVIMGVVVPRRVVYVARSSLGRIPLIGLWMRAVGVIFIDRKAPSKDALVKAMQVLESGGVLGYFPEGTRTKNGELQAFQRGLLLLLKKSQAAVVPVGIRGSFSALPPGALLPRPRKCAVHFGAPRPAEEVRAAGGLEALHADVALLLDTQVPQAAATDGR